MSYLQDDKIKFLNLKEKTADYIYSNSDKLEVLLSFFERHKELIMNVTYAVLLLVIIFLFVFNIESIRVNRYLGRMIVTKMKNPLKANNDYTDSINNYRLADFYIASAYKCYLPCTYYYDYSSIDAIIKCITSGARYLHFDIFPDVGLWNGGLRPDAEPVVCNGIEVGNWHSTTSIPFDEVCRVVNVFALGNAAPNAQNIITKVDTYNTIINAKDPLFIHLSLKCWGQTSVIDKCADLLIRYFGNNLLAAGSNENFKYAFCGMQSNTNIGLTPITELMGRVIIICDADDPNDIKNSKIFEITNISPNFAGTSRMNNYENIRDIQDQNELIEYNKQNMTIVRPTEIGRDKENYNFYTPWYLGCQFISMNFTLNDPFINNYLNLKNRFGEYSFVLKPKNLRYKPIMINAPTEQKPQVSFAPQTITTPYGSFIT